MAALLVALSVMAILMTAVMPVWKQTVQREKEEELVFRGLQYAHALTLFSRKYANASPPNLDVLVEQRFLRKKYKDPVTNDDFQPILAGQSTSGATQPGGQPQPGTGGRGAATPGRGASTAAGGRGTSPVGTPGAGGPGGIIGVTSKSKGTSIRLYKGRSHYNEWAFVATQPQQTPGAAAPGAGIPGQPQRGQPGQGTNPFGGTTSPGQRGRGGFSNPNAPGGPGGRGFNPGGGSPFQPTPQPPPGGRGRSGG